MQIRPYRLLASSCFCRVHLRAARRFQHTADVTICPAAAGSEARALPLDPIHFRHGEQRQLCLEALRVAKGPATARQVTEHVCGPRIWTWRTP